MAFSFVPPFEEGDKQTNPDTGVEYIYLDGAWRALGPKIEDEFDTLDERYVNVSGDTMSGQLTITRSRNLLMTKEDGSSQFEIRPNINAADYFTNIYGYNAGGMRFRVATEQNAGVYDTMISITGETQTIGDRDYRGVAYINRVRTPTNPDHAANKYYVDNALENIEVEDINLDGYATEDYVDEALEDYLPLAGGTMTGKLELERVGNATAGFTVKGRDDSDNDIDLLTVYHNNSGLADAVNYNGRTSNDNNIANLGWVKSWTDDFLDKTGDTMTGLLEFDRTNNQRVNFKTNGSSVNCDIARDGTWQISLQETQIKLQNKLDLNNHKIVNLSDPTSNKDAAHKKYIDDKVPGRFYVQSGSLFYEA